MREISKYAERRRGGLRPGAGEGVVTSWAQTRSVRSSYCDWCGSAWGIGEQANISWLCETRTRWDDDVGEQFATSHDSGKSGWIGKL